MKLSPFCSSALLVGAVIGLVILLTSCGPQGQTHIRFTENPPRPLIEADAPDTSTGAVNYTEAKLFHSDGTTTKITCGSGSGLYTCRHEDLVIEKVPCDPDNCPLPPPSHGL